MTTYIAYLYRQSHHANGKVSYILVTSHLKKFLEDYPPSAEKQAFLYISTTCQYC